jgi:putative flippase GtrA
MTFVWRFLRYATVSAISTVLSLTVLGVLVFTGAMTPGWANIAATAVGTVPSFELNRRWVWVKRGRRSLAGEVGPFWAMSFVGLALSTAAVTAAARLAGAAGLDNAMRTLVVEIANLAGFGSMWIAQYLLLDRVLFGRRPRSVASLLPPLCASVPSAEPVSRSLDAA